MKRSTYLVLGFCLLLTVAAAPSQSMALTYFQDDFDASSDGDLTGQSPQVGGDWQANGLWVGPVTMTVGAVDAVSGKGAGANGSGTPGTGMGNRGPFATPASTGIVSAGWDLVIPPGNSSHDGFVYLVGANGHFGFLNLDTNAGTGPGFIQVRGHFTGTDSPDTGYQNAIDTGFGDGGGEANLILNIDLDNRTVDISFQDLNNPANSVTWVMPGNIPQTAIDTYLPITSIDLFSNTTTATGPRGFDNILVQDERIGSVTPPFIPPDFTWNSGVGGDWNTAVNWTGGPNPPPGNQADEQASWHTATFGDVIGSGPSTVFTDESVTVNSITFANTMGGSYRIAGGPINLNASTAGVASSLAVDAGSHEFQAVVQLLSNTEVDAASGSTLAFNNALNLMGNTLTKTGLGTVDVNNLLTLGGGTINIQQGTIGGNGTIGGDVSNTGGTVSPGSSAASSPDSVPEPTAMLLGALGLGILVTLRRRINSYQQIAARVPDESGPFIGRRGDRRLIVFGEETRSINI